MSPRNSLGALDEISPSPVPHHSAVLGHKLPLLPLILKDHAVWDIVRGPTSIGIQIGVGVDGELHLVLATGEGEFFTIAKVMGVFAYHAEREQGQNGKRLRIDLQIKGLV